MHDSLIFNSILTSFIYKHAYFIYNRCRSVPLACLIVWTALTTGINTHAEDIVVDPAPAATEQAPALSPATALRLPEIGKWMLRSSGDVAHWLGTKFQNRVLDEPINVIIKVHGYTAADAIKALRHAMKLAGFKMRVGHSSGYRASIGGKIFDQFPGIRGTAFSDGLFLTANDHGRFFGPLDNGSGEFYFVGALSREGTAYAKMIRNRGGSPHTYESFTVARERFSENMQRWAHAKLIGLVPLNNSIVGDGPETTGDHDGNAVLLEL